MSTTWSACRGRSGCSRSAAPGLGSSFPPLRTGRSRVGNLVASVTSFVGHGEELARLVAELPARPMVTLTGVGGVGKTRLATEAARAAAGEFPDGVWLCELAPVADPDAVAHAVATTLAVRRQEGLSMLDSVVDALRGRRLLLILDNCEHVLDAAAELARRVTASCPTVALLATSREPVGVAAERVWAVPSLDAAVEGVELFCDRAAAADAAFSPTEADRAVIAGICGRLDGIPLAIELAAARVRSMTPSELAGRLDDRFRLLRGGRRGGLERHQTLRATVQWSHQLLTGQERALFDRLAVFAGGFDLDSAEAVCADDTIDPLDVGDLLAALVDKSMVVADRHGPRTRYRLLETLRQYGEERLAADGRAGPAAGPAPGPLRGDDGLADGAVLDAEEPAVWAAFDLEWDNLRAALEQRARHRRCRCAGGDPRHDGPLSLFSDRAEVGPWARDAIESGALEGHPAEPDVRGAWAVWEYWCTADVPATARALAYGDDAGQARTYGASTTVALASFMVAHARGDGPHTDAITRSWLSAPDGLLGEVLARGDRAVYGSWFGDESVDRASMGVQRRGWPTRRLSLDLRPGHASSTGYPSLAATRPQRRTCWRRDAAGWGRWRSGTG